jgi:hypothetical protein
MVRDRARSDLPKGACWDLVDIIPNYDAPARKRGGWVTILQPWAVGSGSDPGGIVYAPYSAGGGLVSTTSTGKLISWLTSAPVDEGAANASLVPFFYRDLVILPAPSGAGSTFKFDGSAAPSAIAGSPNAVFGLVHKDHAALGGPSTNKRRWYFSSAGDPLTYDLTNGWLDVDSPIIAGASIRGSMLSLETDKVELIRGDVPPPGPFSDFSKNSIGDQGCAWAQSLAVYKDQAIWGNRAGIWVSDGTTPWDLTKMAGVSQYWQSLMVSAANPATVGAFVYRGLYVVSLGSSADTAIVFDIENRVCLGRFSNLGMFQSFASTEAEGYEEVYSLRNDNSQHLVALSPIWTPVGLDDGNAIAQAPAIETPFFNLEGSNKRLERTYVSYELSTGSIQISWTREPETGAAVYATSGPFGPATSLTRKRISSPMKGYGFGLRIEGGGGTIGDLRVYAIEVDGRAMDGSR